MQSRLLLRQSSSPDVVTLPDVGRMGRLEFRDLEARLYGQSRQTTRAAASISANSPQARQVLEVRPVAELRSVGRRVYANSAAHSSTAFQRSWPEIRTPPSSWHETATRQGADIANGSTGSSVNFITGRATGREIRELLQLQGSEGNDSFRGTRTGPAPGRALVAESGISLATSAEARAQTTASTDRRQHPNRNLDDTVHIPDVGRMSRRQLQRLETVLRGNENFGEDELAELPDLTGMDANQLSQIESALAGRFDSTTIGSLAEDTVANPESQPNTSPSPSAQQNTQYSSTLGQQVIHAPQSFPSTPSSNLEAPPLAIRDETCHPWRIVEEAFQKLRVSPDSMAYTMECSICCQPIQDGAMALPCSKHSCDSYFHSACLRPWLERNPSCPLCRCSVKELVTSVAPQCRGCGGAVASPDALLAAMGLAELMGRQRAMAWLFRQRGTVPGRSADSNAGFPAEVLAALGGEIDPSAFVPELLAAILASGLSEDDSLVSSTPIASAPSGAPRASFRDARAHLEGIDLANRLQTYGGQWHSAATLLGLAHPLASETNTSQRAESAQINSSSQSSPTRAAEQVDAPNPRRLVRSSTVSAAPPSRWFVSQQTADGQRAPQQGRLRQSELVLETSSGDQSIPVDIAATRGAANRPIGSSLGGGWRPSSRGASRYASVPQLARTSVSIARAVRNERSQ